MAIKTKELGAALAALANNDSPAKLVGLDGKNSPTTTTMAKVAEVAGGLRAKYECNGTSVLLKIAENKVEQTLTIRVQEFGYGNSYQECYIGIRRTLTQFSLTVYNILGSIKFLANKDKTELFIKTGDWSRFKITHCYGNPGTIMAEVSDVDESTLTALN